jgi:hypothetical protein
MAQERLDIGAVIKLPAPWIQPRTQSSRGLAAMIGLVVFFLVADTLMLAFEEYTLFAVGLPLLGCSISLLATTHHVVFLPWRRNSAGVTRFPLLARNRSCAMVSYAAGARNSYYALMAVLLVLFSTAPLLVHLVPPDGTWRGGSIRLLAPFIPILTLLPILTFAGKLVRKRRELGIGLAREGLYHWSWLGCRFIDWDWIVGIHASPVSAPRINLTLCEPTLRPRNEEESWVTRLKVVRRPDNVPAAFLNVHPNVVYYALWFYYKHPEFRSELETEAGVERIRRMDFSDVIAEVRERGDILTRAAGSRRRPLGR